MQSNHVRGEFTTDRIGIKVMENPKVRLAIRRLFQKELSGSLANRMSEQEVRNIVEEAIGKLEQTSATLIFLEKLGKIQGKGEIMAFLADQLLGKIV